MTSRFRQEDDLLEDLQIFENYTEAALFSSLMCVGAMVAHLATRCLFCAS